MRISRYLKKAVLPAALVLPFFSTIVEAKDVTGLSVIVNFQPETFTSNDPQCKKESVQAANLTQKKNIEQLINKENYQGNGNVGSLYDYFLDNSSGQFKLKNIVVSVTLNQTRSYYACMDNNFDGVIDGDMLGQTGGIPDLVGGPLFELKNNVLAKLNNASYQEFMNGNFVNATAAFNFNRLSKTTTKLSLDWLDQIAYIFGEDDIQITFGSINHLEFFQLVVPGGWGAHYGAGLWARSIPSTRSEISGVGGVGRILLTPLGNLGTDLVVGTMAHEAAHTLFALKDLYDTELESPLPFKGANGTEYAYNSNHPSPTAFKSHGVHTYSLMGFSETTNPPLIDAYNRALIGWDQPKDLYYAAEGEVYTVDWHADGSNSNIAKSFKYCKPNSSLNECFYIEARPENMNRAFNKNNGYVRYANTPSNGLMIWHGETYNSVANYKINERKEGTAGLHFGVSLVQADGVKELESPINNSMTLSTDLFGNGNNRFDDVTSPSAKWWDGTDSGFAITDIKYTTDGKMSFKIGKRPMKKIYFAFDPSEFDLKINNATISYPNYILLPLGSTATLKVTPLLNQSYKIAGEPAHFSTAIQTGIINVEIKADTEKSLISFRSSTFRGLTEEFSFAAGKSKLTTYNVNNKVLLSGTGLGQFLVTPENGYRVAGSLVKVTRSGGQTSRHGGSGELVEVKVPEDYWSIFATITTEPIPGLFCSEGKTEEWKWDGEYKEIGTRVRYNNVVYATNVPRATIYENRPLFAQNPSNFTPITPDQRPKIFTPVEICGPYVAQCSGAPTWEPNTAATTVTYGNKLWSLTSGTGGVMPGDYPNTLTLENGNILTPDNILALHPNKSAKWKLEGNCNTNSNVSRAYIQKSPGVSNVRSNTNTSIIDGHWQPIYTWWFSKALYLNFDIDAGYRLVDVYVDGVPSNLSSNARSHSIYFNSLPRQAHYVEIRTKRE